MIKKGSRSIANEDKENPANNESKLQPIAKATTFRYEGLMRCTFLFLILPIPMYKRIAKQIQ